MCRRMLCTVVDTCLLFGGASFWAEEEEGDGLLFSRWLSGALSRGILRAGVPKPAAPCDGRAPPVRPTPSVPALLKGRNKREMKAGGKRKGNRGIKLYLDTAKLEGFAVSSVQWYNDKQRFKVAVRATGFKLWLEVDRIR